MATTLPALWSGRSCSTQMLTRSSVSTRNWTVTTTYTIATHTPLHTTCPTTDAQSFEQHIGCSTVAAAEDVHKALWAAAELLRRTHDTHHECLDGRCCVLLACGKCAHLNQPCWCVLQHKHHTQASMAHQFITIDNTPVFFFRGPWEEGQAAAVAHDQSAASGGDGGRCRRSSVRLPSHAHHRRCVVNYS